MLTRTELLARLHDAVSQMDDAALAALVELLENGRCPLAMADALEQARKLEA